MNKKHIISLLITEVDKRLSETLHSVVHNSLFADLEARWTSLNILTSSLNRKDESLVKIKILNLSYKELFALTTDYQISDANHLYRFIAQQEFDQAGGEPFNIIIADYYFDISNQSGDTISIVQALCYIANECFCLFLAGLSSHSLSLTDFSQLSPLIDIETTFMQQQYSRWKKLRYSSDARNIAFLLPRFLIRPPHNSHLMRKNTQKQSNYLWGNPSYLYVRAQILGFQQSGWFLNAHSSNKNLRMKRWSYSNIRYFNNKHNARYPTEIFLSGPTSRSLSEQGFLPVNTQRHTHQHDFQQQQTIYRSKKTSNSSQKQLNNSISYSIPYLLSINRFAHYIKNIIRHKIGLFENLEHCQQYINRWLLSYCASTTDHTDVMQDKYPLKSAYIHLKPIIGKYNAYFCHLELCPHDLFNNHDTILHLSSTLQLTLKGDHYATRS